MTFLWLSERPNIVGQAKLLCDSRRSSGRRSKRGSGGESSSKSKSVRGSDRKRGGGHFVCVCMWGGEGSVCVSVWV